MKFSDQEINLTNLVAKLKMYGKPSYINFAGSLADLTVPKVMGIINVTPDSFYDGSRCAGQEEIEKAAATMIAEGADIIDVGGHSTRPGSAQVPEELERERVIFAISTVRKLYPDCIVSVDTYRSSIAAEAVESAGASVINDITGGEGDRAMFDVVSRLNVPYILMHMQGTPATMQLNPVYDDVVADILTWFAPRIAALREKGVKDIVIDPGFGFGKSASHNFELLRRLGEFSVAGLPIMAGLSRKAIVWKSLGTSPAAALNGTTALNMAALLGGADFLRVHDVKEAVETVKLFMLLKRGGKDA